MNLGTHQGIAKASANGNTGIWCECTERTSLCTILINSGAIEVTDQLINRQTKGGVLRSPKLESHGSIRFLKSTRNNRLIHIRDCSKPLGNVDGHVSRKIRVGVAFARLWTQGTEQFPIWITVTTFGFSRTILSKSRFQENPLHTPAYVVSLGTRSAPSGPFSEHLWGRMLDHLDKRLDGKASWSELVLDRPELLRSGCLYRFDSDPNQKVLLDDWPDRVCGRPSLTSTRILTEDFRAGPKDGDQRLLFELM